MALVGSGGMYNVNDDGFHSLRIIIVHNKYSNIYKNYYFIIIRIV